MGKHKHGFGTRTNRHPLYKKWMCTKSRCHNKNNKQYENYGGRGILMCDEWLNNAQSFVEWCLSNGWREDLQIDRINNNKGYSPENCHFVTAKENSNNRRRRKDSNKFIGVYANAKQDRFRSAIGYGEKVIHLGTFTNPIDAAVTRDSYVISNYLNRELNFPQPIIEIR